MGWQEKLKYYKDGNTTGNEKTDNSVVTQVMRGLGIRRNNLPAFEKACDMNPDFNTPDWIRLLKCIRFVSHNQIGTRMLIQTDDTDEKHCILDKMDEITEVGKKYPDGVIVLCRVKNSLETIGYAFLPDNGMPPDWILHPKSTLLERKNGYLVWCRKIEDLIRDLSEAKKWTLMNNE